MNLLPATWSSAINFWAENTIGPLSTAYVGDIRLSSAQAAMLMPSGMFPGEQ